MEITITNETKQKLWCDTYVAAIRNGYDSGRAAGLADDGVKALCRADVKTSEIN